MDVSIILVNYKTPELTKNALLSVQEKSSGFSYECIVVDNSEDPQEFEELTKEVGSLAKVIDAKGNLGFGRANNLGASHAEGKYLFFLNTDTLLVNNAVKELFSFCEANQPCAVGPNLYTKEGKPNHSFIRNQVDLKSVEKEASISRYIRKAFLNKRDDFNYQDHPLEIYGYICGAALMVPKEEFLKVGGFDKDIFMYAEDNLLGYQLRKNGVHLFNVPSAKVIHFEGGSDDSASPSHVNNLLDGNKIYFTKAYSREYYIDYLKTLESNYKKKLFLSKLTGKKKLKEKYTVYLETVRERLEKEESKNT